MSEGRQYVVYDRVITKLHQAGFEYLSKWRLEDRVLCLLDDEATAQKVLEDFLRKKFDKLISRIPFNATTSVPAWRKEWFTKLLTSPLSWDFYGEGSWSLPATSVDRLLLSGFFAFQALTHKELLSFQEYGFRTYTEFVGTAGAVLLCAQTALNESGNLNKPKNMDRKIMVRDPGRNDVLYRPLLK
ncbi:MAG: hypothetical protein Q7K43_03485 [Candidatus Woesearchaeota archaeon]|nr:hypothetical protein [Candidatus Woesearchaeota archaeon]